MAGNQINRQGQAYTHRSPQEVQNLGFDELYQVPTTALLAYRADLDSFVPVNMDSAGNVKTNASVTGGAGGTSSTYGSTFPTTGTAIGATDGVNMKALQVDGSGNLKVAGTFSSTVAAANDSWGQALATTNGSTATVVNIASSTAGYQIKGMVCHGTGDGYFFIQVASSTVLSGRIRSSQPTLVLSLPNGISVTTASTVTLKVTNESGSTADFEATLLGA